MVENKELRMKFSGDLLSKIGVFSVYIMFYLVIVLRPFK